jgi:hypothetical protein
VNDPFEMLAETGRALRIWANVQSAPLTFGEARQIVKFTLGSLDIPQEFQRFVFHPPEPEPFRTPRDKRILETVDTVFVEISERQELIHDRYCFQINYFFREFVSKYGGPLLPWYRALSLKEPITEDLVMGALEKLRDRDPEELKFIEMVLCRTRLSAIDVETATQTFEDIRYGRPKQWVLVSHFVVPGLGGTQMKDRAEVIDLVRAVAVRNSIAMYDPTDLLTRHGREAALASEGRDIYHYRREFNVTVANALLQAAGLIAAPMERATALAESPSPPDSVFSATERVNNTLLQLHQDRVDKLGVDKSGLYVHYKGLLDGRRIADQQICSLAALILNLLPRFDAYHVLRAGLGELAFVLASTGLQVAGFDPDSGRFAAMTAGRDVLCKDDPELGRRLTVARGSIPSINKNNRTLAIAHHLIGYKTEQQEAVLAELSSYAAVLIDPRIFLFPRKSQEEQDATIEDMKSRGFIHVREFPQLGIAFCSKPEALSAQETDGAAAPSLEPANRQLSYPKAMPRLGRTWRRLFVPPG